MLLLEDEMWNSQPAGYCVNIERWLSMIPSLLTKASVRATEKQPVAWCCHLPASLWCSLTDMVLFVSPNVSFWTIFCLCLIETYTICHVDLVIEDFSLLSHEHKMFYYIKDEEWSLIFRLFICPVYGPCKSRVKVEIRQSWLEYQPFPCAGKWPEDYLNNEWLLNKLSVELTEKTFSRFLVRRLFRCNVLTDAVKPQLHLKISHICGADLFSQI